MDIRYTFVAIALAIIIIIYITILRKKPSLLGLDKNRSKQFIDKAEFKRCPVCNNNSLEPRFHWWRYLFIIRIPFLIFYIIGPPNEYHCNNCNKVITGEHKRQITRLPLSHPVARVFAIFQIIGFAIVATIFIVIVRILKH